MAHKIQVRHLESAVRRLLVVCLSVEGKARRGNAVFRRPRGVTGAGRAHGRGRGAQSCRAGRGASAALPVIDLSTTNDTDVQHRGSPYGYPACSHHRRCRRPATLTTRDRLQGVRHGTFQPRLILTREQLINPIPKSNLTLTLILTLNWCPEQVFTFVIHFVRPFDRY